MKSDVLCARLLRFCTFCMSRDLADNKVFFQHPDLMRSLGIHETVMTLMVNTLNKAQQHPPAVDTDTTQRRRSSVVSNSAAVLAIRDEPTVSWTYFSRYSSYDRYDTWKWFADLRLQEI